MQSYGCILKSVFVLSLIHIYACLIFGSKEKPAFHDCKSIEKIIFSDNVKTIGSYMASGLGNLTSIEFPKALERIENSAFYGCIGLTSLRFPDTLEYVGENAFFGCLALSTFNEPSKLYEIGSGAFENTAWYNICLLYTSFSRLRRSV